MNVIALVLIAVAPGADPLPDNKMPIDSLTYTFGGGGLLGAGGSLKIGSDGKVRYSYISAPHTGSGGIVVEKEWELTKDEMKELFAKLVSDGLLDGAEAVGGIWASGGAQVTSGRWRTTVAVSDKALERLRPLLAKAHPAKWVAKAPAPREAKPNPSGLKQFNYWFAPKAEGDNALLYLGRDGDVSYQRYSNTGKVTTTHVQTAWKIPAADAATILDAIAAGGVLALEDVGGGKFPVHRVEAQVGRWYTLFYVKELPETDRKLLLPLLKKADPEFWK